MLIILLRLLNIGSWIVDWLLLAPIIQCAAGLIFVLSYLVVEKLLQCIGENEDVVIGNINSLPISETLNDQLSEQMHCIAQYYRDKTNDKVFERRIAMSTKYKVIMHYPDGETEELDEIFDTESAAEEEALYMCSCYDEGGDTLYMSNPGDYPLEMNCEVDYEIVEIDE